MFLPVTVYWVAGRSATEVGSVVTVWRSVEVGGSCAEGPVRSDKEMIGRLEFQRVAPSGVSLTVQSEGYWKE